MHGLGREVEELAALPGWSDLVQAGSVTPLGATAVDEHVIPLIRAAALREAGHRIAQRRRRRRRVLLASAVAVAVLVGSLLPVTRQWRLGGAASAAAAEVLGRAAITASDPMARPDQYWEVVSDDLVASYVSRDEVFASYLVRSRRTSYVAVDGTRPSWFVDSPSTIVRQLGGPTGLEPPDDGAGEVWTTDLTPVQQGGSWQSPTPAFLAALPRDVSALRDRLYADTVGRGRSADGEVLVYVADVLRSGVVPADLRAALYRVLQTVPGVEVTAADVTVDGRRGVALGRLETVDGQRQEIVVDPGTGELVGERDVQVDSSAGIPAGTVVGQSSTTRSVVDRVPVEVQRAARRDDCRAVDGGAVECLEGRPPSPVG